MTEPDKNRLLVTQDILESEVAALVDSAPETLDTLSELAEALGNDPNFATTTATAIGERAKTSDVNAALAGKADLVDGKVPESQLPEIGGGESLVWTDGAGAFGIGTTDVGAKGVAFGSSPAEGMPAASAGDFAAAVGPSASAGEQAAAIGAMASADDYAAAIGIQASAGEQAAAIGYGASAGLAAAAIGNFASAGTYAAAIGPTASATGYASVALGYGASTSNADEIALGSSSAHVQVAGSLNVDGSLTTGGTPLTAAEVGLGNVDNTSDAARPVSTAQQAAINAKIQLVSSFPASPVAGVLYLVAE